MSILNSIVTKIFRREPAAPETATAASREAPAPSTPAPSTPAPSGASTGGTTEVDVESVLTDLASKASERLDWRHSIVDLMKLLGLDSSLAARKSLAGELHYAGDTNDSAAMNIWLHKQVMQKLAENGGKVPEELKA